MIGDFEEYIEEEVVSRISPDLQRAESLKIEAGRKYSLLKKQISLMGGR